MRAGPWRRTVDATTSNEAKKAMQAQTTQPRGFVTPVVTEIVPPWRRPRPASR
jgi:hypothetical protein